MARKLKPNDDGQVTKNHNVRGRQTIIRECAAQMADVKVRRQGCNEDAAAIRERLRDAGIQTKAFDFAVRVREMEADGQAEYLDSLRENFAALAIGGQGSLFVKDDPETPTPKRGRKKVSNSGPVPVDRSPLSEANQAGVTAGLDGQPRDSNPHHKGATENEYWDKGWLAGQKQIAATMRTDGGAKGPEPRPAA